jgi:hypothetical protein
MVQKDETYQLIINTPKMDDMGRYTCEINGIKTEAFLTVEGIKVLKSGYKKYYYFVNYFFFSLSWWIL